MESAGAPGAAPLLHPGAHVPVAVQAVPFLAALLVAGIVLGLVFGPWGIAPIVVLFAFVLFFFRDPARLPPEGAGLVLSPADGRITEVHRGPEGVRVSGFLSGLGCHIHPSPVGGAVREDPYPRGRLHPAWQGPARPANERNHPARRS